MSFLQQRLQQQRTKCYYQNQKKDKKRKSKTGLPKPERDNTIVSHTPDEVQTVDTQLQTTADRKHTCSNNKSQQNIINSQQNIIKHRPNSL